MQKDEHFNKIIQKLISTNSTLATIRSPYQSSKRHNGVHFVFNFDCCH